jgi:hypothetical protein
VFLRQVRAGFTAQIRSLLKKYRCDKLSGVDPANFKALLADVEDDDAPKGHAILPHPVGPLAALPTVDRLCESYDDMGSNYAAEGTDATRFVSSGSSSTRHGSNRPNGT